MDLPEGLIDHKPRSRVDSETVIFCPYNGRYWEVQTPIRVLGARLTDVAMHRSFRVNQGFLPGAYLASYASFCVSLPSQFFLCL